jgi:hypothetical protein
MDWWRELDISEILKGRLSWLGHVDRMPEERTVKKVYVCMCIITKSMHCSFVVY